MKKSTAQMLFVSTLSLAALTACGGGGGGDSTTAPAPLPTVSVSISTSGLPVMYTGRSVSLTATGTSSANLALTYTWDFGDNTTTGTGATPAHTFAKAGTYTVKVTATDTNGTKATASGTITIVDAVLTTPTVTPTAVSAVANSAVTFNGASSDPSGGTLTYNWDFGDNTTSKGASVQHTYNAAGTYRIVLNVSNDLGVTATTAMDYCVKGSANALCKPVINASRTVVGQATDVNLSVRAPDQNLTYTWDFGDGSKATGASVKHNYAALGNFNVTVTATDANKNTSASDVTQIAVYKPAVGSLTPTCTGTNCNATGPSTYAGSGVGVWQYQNTSADAAVLDFSITGVKAGQVATLVFTNTSDAQSLSAPGFGAAPVAIPVASTNALSLNMQALNRHAQMDTAHQSMHQRNHDLIQQMRAKPAAIRAAGVKAANVPPVRAVAVGDTKVWVDTYDSANPVSYTLKVAQICKLKTGRNAVIWGDPNGGATASDLLALANTFCSNGGAGTAGFDALTDIMGDAFGTKSYSNTISDTNGLLDINVVVPNVPSTTKWGGYFWGGNNFLKTAFASTKNSNEALVFFVNGQQVSQALNYYKSTLMHEAVHMINFYQRAFVLDTDHDTWLEETTAMMGEDILAKTIFGGSYNEMTQVRIPQYLRTGGGVSYVNWTNLSSDSYAFGGAFGAFINRKYGVSMFKKIVTDCKDGTISNVTYSSYSCMDTLIKAAGGVGMGDELAKFGISLWGNTPASALPSGLGFPQRTTDGVFDAIDVATVVKSLKITPKSPIAMVPSSHYFAQEVIGTGKTSLSKNGVVVPAGATLHIMVRDAAP